MIKINHTTLVSEGRHPEQSNCLTVERPPLGPPKDQSWPVTFINSRDGSTMRLVPAGRFTMGSTAADVEFARHLDRNGFSFDLMDEMPQFDLFVPAFYVSLYAVTNRQFARFLTELQPSPALLDFWVNHYVTGHIQWPEREGEPYLVEAGFEQHPAVLVTWFGASAYSQWAALRLPKEVEWEKSARGTDGRLFPWGNQWRDNFLRSGRRGRHGRTAPVDAYPEGRSFYGIYQMAGNVAEWCKDWYQPDAYIEHVLGSTQSPFSGDERVLRGGTCAQSRKLEFRCARRQMSTPVFPSMDFTGIRCACDLPGQAV